MIFNGKRKKRERGKGVRSGKVKRVKEEGIRGERKKGDLEKERETHRRTRERKGKRLKTVIETEKKIKR